jgi:hypothetical protein
MTPDEAQAFIADRLAAAFPCLTVERFEEEGRKVVTAIWPATGDGTAIMLPNVIQPDRLQAAIDSAVLRLWHYAPIAGRA